MREIWTELFAGKKRTDGIRARFAKEHRDRAAARARSFAEGQQAGGSTVFRRNREVRLRLYPWTFADLVDLANARTVAPATVGAAIVESVVELWTRYLTDEDLFLARCDDPSVSHSVISLAVNARPFLAAVGTWDNHDLRLFGTAVLRCLERGIPAETLQKEIASLASLK